MTFLSSLVETLGCSEDGLRLILGQLLGYPVMLIYRWIIANQNSTSQHFYFIFTGQLGVHSFFSNEIYYDIELHLQDLWLDCSPLEKR